MAVTQLAQSDHIILYSADSCTGAHHLRTEMLAGFQTIQILIHQDLKGQGLLHFHMSHLVGGLECAWEKSSPGWRYSYFYTML